MPSFSTFGPFPNKSQLRLFPHWVTRLKYHLARLSAHDANVMACMVSSAEVIQKTLEAIAEQDKKKAARERPMVSDR